MGKISAGSFVTGAASAGINELLIGEIEKASNGDPAMMQWLSVGIGNVLGEIASGNAQLGASVAVSGTKNNDLLMSAEEIYNEMMKYGRKEEYRGLGMSKENEAELEKLLKQNWDGADAIMVTFSTGVTKRQGSTSIEIGGIYDLASNKVYGTLGGEMGMSGVEGTSLNSGGGATVAAVRIIAIDPTIDVKNAVVREEIFEGESWSVLQGYYGIGGGINIPVKGKYKGKVALILVGIGTPQIATSVSTTKSEQNLYKLGQEFMMEKKDKLEAEIEGNRFGAD